MHLIHLMLSEIIHVFLNGFREGLLWSAEASAYLGNAYRSSFVEGALEIFLALDL